MKELAGDTQLTREEILEWFRWWESLPEGTRASMHEARVAAETAAADRTAHLKQQKAERTQAAMEERLRYQGEASRG